MPVATAPARKTWAWAVIAARSEKKSVVRSMAHRYEWSGGVLSEAEVRKLRSRDVEKTGPNPGHLDFFTPHLSTADAEGNSTTASLPS
jgi:hypothetical protein